MPESCDVLVIGGGPAGLSAAVFTARAGLDTVVADRGDSILRRNAHLENFPGFPWGIDARLLLSLMAEQAEAAGARRQAVEIARLAATADGFRAETTDGDSVEASRAICATKNEVGYLAEVEGVEVLDRGKSYVAVDDRGRTGVSGLYAAGRLAGKPHQAVVAAGHGAEVGITLLEDAEAPFYHDWVVPDAYFTGRERDVPPGCEEIDDPERRRRSDASLQAIRDRLDDPELEPPEQHPSVAGE